MKEFRVYGPPGTGKTTTISREIGRAVEQFGTDRVLVASFTRAAARELVSRDLPVEEENIGTLHALAWRGLGRPKIAEVNAGEWNKRSGLNRITGTGGLDDMDGPSGGDEGDRRLAMVNTLRAKLVPLEQWPREARAFHAEWEQWKLDTGYLDFTDIIEKAITLLPYAPGAPKVGFYDEVQDFTALELKLARRWAEHMDFAVFAGDDDQAIFGFKGSVPEAFIYPELPEDQVRVLGQSHRVPQVVQELASRWVASVRDRYPKTWSGRDARGVMHMHGPPYRDGHALVRRVEQLEGSVMVLTTCSYMLKPFIRELRQQGIPFFNPYRSDRGDWNPLKLPKARQVATWQAVQSFLQPTWTVRDVIRFHRLFKKSQFHKEGLAELAAWPDETVVGSELAERIFTDPEGIAAGGREYLRDNVLAAKKNAIEYPMKVSMNHGADALGRRPRLIVGTVHSVKGGEADHVLLMPDLSRSGQIQTWNDPDPTTRLFYVGMTRARESLTLCDQSSPAAVEWPRGTGIEARRD